MMYLPESPIYYLKSHRREEAQLSLQWFRGDRYDIDPELSSMQKNIEIVSKCVSAEGLV